MEKEIAKGMARHEGADDGCWRASGSGEFTQKRHKEKRAVFGIMSRKELLDVRAIFKKWVVSHGDAACEDEDSAAE